MRKFSILEVSFPSLRPCTMIRGNGGIVSLHFLNHFQVASSMLEIDTCSESFGVVNACSCDIDPGGTTKSSDGWSDV
jgi:hypothetical protein